jgi:hypothetical protein
MLKIKYFRINIGSHKDKNVDSVDNVELPYSVIELIGIPLFVLYVVMCIETSVVASTKIVPPRSLSTNGVLPYGNKT